jgi:L-alanine-DL-glutamate epimerase-like enolase superfamily enzyme
MPARDLSPARGPGVMEPLVPDDIPGLARVRASVATPIAAG